MITFRRKWYSFLKGGNETMIKKITDKLDKARIYDYDLDTKIPKDVISINTNLNALEVYLPKDNDFAQYGIDTKVREMIPYTRTSVDLERDIYVVRIKAALKPEQYYELIKYIIEEEGFCVIVDPNITK